MEEEEDMSSPFWLQSTRQAGHHRRRSSSSFLFNSGALLIFLLAVAVAFIFIVIPSIQSFTSQILKPHSVKKSWDSVNLVLVLFAIICGFLSRNNNNNNNESIATTPTTTAAAGASYESEEYNFENRSESFHKSNPETPRRFWYDHAYNNDNNNNNNNNNGGLSRLRSFSSHPDLRQEEALWANIEDQWRFSDDTHLYHNRFSSFDHKQLHQWRPQPQPKLEGLAEEKVKKENDKVDVVKNVDADNTTPSTVEESLKEIIYTPPQTPPASPSPEPAELPPSQSPTPPLPPPQSKVVRRRVKRTHHENGGNYRNNDLEVKPPPPPQRQPPPSPAPPEPEIEESGGKSEKKRGGTSATKEFLTSLRRKKKKRLRQKSVENLDSFFNYESSYPLPPSLIPPPSPPPPPPPPPFFQNIFSPKKRKAKKIHSVIPSPPPPPPPPPTRTQKLSTSRTRNVQSTSQKPSSPLKIKSYSNVEQNVNSGNESPLNAIPPPPPLPPFKMPAWKFEVHGDFVRLKSNNIGADDVEESSSLSDGGGSPPVTPLFCPSPDVNAKADNFIARFRAGLRLEKMNSVKEKEGRGRSNLGPEPSPAQGGESPS